MPDAEDRTPAAAATRPGQCQYFVLSPRPSLESPTRRPQEGADENADHNVKRSATTNKATPKKTALGIAKKVPAAKATAAKAKASTATEVAKAKVAAAKAKATAAKAKLEPAPPVSSANNSPAAPGDEPAPRAPSANKLAVPGSRVSTPGKQKPGTGSSSASMQRTPGSHSVPSWQPVSALLAASQCTPGSQSVHSSQTPASQSVHSCNSMQQTPGSQSVHSLSMTPGRTPRQTPRTTPMRTPGTLCQSEPDLLNSSVYSACPSVFSEFSQTSRIDQLSRKSFSKKYLSTEELEEQRVEKKKQEVNRLLRRNQANCRKAILGTDVASTGRVQSNRKLTSPSEFNLSTSRFSPRSPSPSCAASDVGSVDGSDLNLSLLSARSNTKWKPDLTVPKGPELRVARRLSSDRRRSRGLSEEPEMRSESESRKITSRPATPDRRQRPATPERKREVLTRPRSAMAERQKAAAASSSSAVSTSSSGLTRQERAEQARKLAQRRKDEEARAKKDKMFVFKRAQSSDDLDQASMLSVDSTRSLRSNLSTSSRSSRLNAGTGAAARPQSARCRRPSFGSTTPRPCNI